MCGRFFLIASAAEIRRKFTLDRVPDLMPRFNIAPTQSALIIVGAAKTRSAHMARWGLVPSWSRDLSLAARMFNALAEEIEDKPVFRSAFAAQRCLVPANGFYEWQTRGARKQPYKIGLRNGALCAFAGLWEKWAPETGEPVETFTIVTTRANKLVSEVHDRMPVIVAPADYQRWLTASEATAKRLLVPYTGAMTIAPVSDRVNNIKEDDVGLIAAIQA
jgi:putative SOS response-associated peptidase YedK